ncbi:MAG: response regulator transcription factor [Lentisphaeria bacterium]|nr:response regulator transcription factor [Lentisphaeria bacterium]
MKILVIEDDKKTADFLLKALKESGYTTIYAADGRAGLMTAKTETFDLAIIDLMLPLVDGFTVIENIRQAQIQVPIIILSAKNALEDKVRALHSGGDLYLEKPFSVTELLANIQAQLRRSTMSAEPTSLTVADLTINLLTRKVVRNGEKIDLPPREYDLLEYLMRNSGRVVTKTMIMEHVWEYNFDPQTNVVETRIYKLREKVDKPFERELIHTVRGIGYILE